MMEEAAAPLYMRVVWCLREREREQGREQLYVCQNPVMRALALLSLLMCARCNIHKHQHVYTHQSYIPMWLPSTLVTCLQKRLCRRCRRHRRYIHHYTLHFSPLIIQ